MWYDYFFESKNPDKAISEMKLLINNLGISDAKWSDIESIPKVIKENNKYPPIEAKTWRIDKL